MNKPRLIELNCQKRKRLAAGATYLRPLLPPTSKVTITSSSTWLSLSADTKSSGMILISAMSRPNPFLGLPRPPRYPQPRQKKHNCILSPWLRCSTRNTQSIRLNPRLQLNYKTYTNQHLNPRLQLHLKKFPIKICMQPPRSLAGTAVAASREGGQPEEGEGGGRWWQVTWLMLVVRVVMVIVLSYWGQPEEGEGGGRWWQSGMNSLVINKLVEMRIDFSYEGLNGYNRIW